MFGLKLKSHRKVQPLLCPTGWILRYLPPPVWKIVAPSRPVDAWPRMGQSAIIALDDGGSSEAWAETIPERPSPCCPQLAVSLATSLPVWRIIALSRPVDFRVLASSENSLTPMIIYHRGLGRYPICWDWGWGFRKLPALHLIDKMLAA